MKHPRKSTATMRRAGGMRSASAKTRKKVPTICFDPAERRRKFAEAVSKGKIQATPALNSDAISSPPADIELLPDAPTARSSTHTQLCVTQTLAEITEDSPAVEAVTEADRVPSVKDARASPILVLITCRAQTARWEEKYRARLYATAAAAYAAYCEIERSDQLWKEFAKIAQACGAFKRPIRPTQNPDKTLLLVMRFVFGWSHDYNRAYKLARGLELYQLEKLAPEQIHSRLQRDGIENLYKAACKKLPYWGKSANEKALMRMGYEPATASDMFGDLDGGSDYDAAKSEAIDSTESDLKRGGRNVFCVKVDDEQLATILAAPEHQRLSVWFESAGTLPDGWRRFRAIKIKKLQKSGPA
ncbi:hypothetical protein NKI34_27300 [Mesorhizobium sp. M0700]|uniref:hypothetical protein n=1 Tax=Mesorhizobium sp. M0700 TaxID=2956988 RepID=UPI00333B0109